MKAKIIIATIFFTVVTGATLYWFDQKPETLEQTLGAVQINIPKQVQPSEKALKIAAYATVGMPDELKKEFKRKYGNESMSDAEFIKTWALRMDADPALMAQNEAIIQKIVSLEGQSTSNSNYEQPENPGSSGYSSNLGSTSAPKRVSTDVCNCKGYDGIGGPCYSGIGGPAYAGIGGPAYAGIGGPCYSGIGGPKYDGIGGPKYDGIGGPAYDGIGGPCYAGIGGPCYSGIGGGGNCPSVCH